MLKHAFKPKNVSTMRRLMVSLVLAAMISGVGITRRPARAAANSSTTPRAKCGTARALLGAQADTITEFPLPITNSRPFGITIGPDGKLYINLFNANKIARMTTDGSFTFFDVPTPNSGPTAITGGADGNLWFTQQTANKIGRMTTQGVFSEFNIPTADSAPLGITGGPDGNVWFVEIAGNKVGRITPAGAITEFTIPTPLSGPLSITAGPDDNLWFTEFGANKIGRITTAGVFAEFPVPTPNSGPFGITSLSDGTLLFTEQRAGKIGQITTSGVITELTADAPNSGPSGIAAIVTDNEEEAAVLRADANTVEVGNPNTLEEFEVCGPGCTNPPVPIVRGQADAVEYLIKCNNGKNEESCTNRSEKGKKVCGCHLFGRPQRDNFRKGQTERFKHKADPDKETPIETDSRGRLFEYRCSCVETPKALASSEEQSADSALATQSLSFETHTFPIPTPSSGAFIITPGPDGFYFTELNSNKIGKVKITPQPDYQLSLDQGTVNGERGTTARVKINIDRKGGFAGNVSVTPPDTSALNIKVKPSAPVSTTGDGATFKLKIKGGAPVGTFQLVFIGKDDSSRERIVFLTLVIQ